MLYSPSLIVMNNIKRLTWTKRPAIITRADMYGDVLNGRERVMTCTTPATASKIRAKCTKLGIHLVCQGNINLTL